MEHVAEGLQTVVFAMVSLLVRAAHFIFLAATVLVACICQLLFRFHQGVELLLVYSIDQAFRCNLQLQNPH